MTNQPLTSNDHAKIVAFILLFLPTLLVFGVGVIPAIFLSFGIFMMKKNKDFSHVETAVKICRIYIILSFPILPLIAIDARDVSALILLLIPTLYLVFISKLFFNPLSEHKEWVEVNGIFSTKPKTNIDFKPKNDVNIIRGENFKQYSVADELIKWAKLKEDGYISDEDFKNARDKILKSD